MIDTHQHFWRYDPVDFGWIPPEWAAIQRDFGPEPLHQLMRQHGVDSCLAVQARQSLEETCMLLQLAGEHPFIAGVVGWLPLASPTLEATLEPLRSNQAFVGARHVLQAEAMAFFEAPALHRGLRILAEHDLVYDLLVTEAQFPQTLALVDQHPNLRFVLDHLGKPAFHGGDLAMWRRGLRELARRPNVTCKISAGVTEIFPRWTPQQLTPMFDEALHAFGPKRLMFGSNWPVCLATGGYDAWLQTVRRWSETMSPDDRAWLFDRTARTVYFHRKPS